jgi:caffeoyl-CoA O-methyltransferase
MTLPFPEPLREYVASHSSPESSLLAELARATRERTDDPGMMSGHVQGVFLRVMVRATAAKRVLEVGTFTGYSALAMAEGLPDDGEVVTCDVDPETTAIAQTFWSRSPHGHKITPRLGPALETIGTLDGPFDLVFIDADKAGYVDYWDACIPKLRRGGLALVDNTLWGGNVVAPKTPEERAIARFNDHIVRDKRVDFLILTARDGVTVAVRR